jgi:site-specific recombinase XerD
MCIRTKTLDRFQRDLEARGVSSSTVATYLRCVRRFLGQLQRAPSRARESDIRDYVVSLRQHYCARSVNVHIAALRCFYNDTLHRRDLLSRVRRLRVQSSPVAILSGSEVLRLLEATRSPKYRALILLMYAAGLRITEALTLCVDDIDSRRMLLRVRRSKTKPRYVPMSPRVLKALRQYWRAARLRGPELFPGRAKGKVATRNGVKRALDKIQRTVELSKHVTPHTFRHCYATHLLDLGADIRTVQVLLGHASLSSTSHYTQLSRARLAATPSPIDVLGTPSGAVLG